MLNATTMERNRVNLRRSVSVQNRQQIFETVPVRHRGTSLDEVALSPERTIVPQPFHFAHNVVNASEDILREGPFPLLTVGADSYPAGLLACSTLGHWDRHALIAPSTWMTAPSVATPRSTNKLKKAKQLSGTASASNKSRFMAKCVCLWLAAQLNSSPLRCSDDAIQKI